MPPPLPRGKSQHARHSTYSPARRSSHRRVAPAVLPARVEHAHVAVEGLLALPAPHVVVGATHPKRERGARCALDRVRLHVFAQVAGAGRHGYRSRRGRRRRRAAADGRRRVCEVGGERVEQRPPGVAQFLLRRRSALVGRRPHVRCIRPRRRPPSSVIAKKAPAKNARRASTVTDAGMRAPAPPRVVGRGARAHGRCATLGCRIRGWLWRRAEQL